MEDYPNYCGQGRARNSTYKELLGVVWLTATKRCNLELFGSFLCFDMMMRGINTLFWPYVGIALMDEFGELCLGCEGIVFGETSEMYQFVVSFIMKHCPVLLMDDVRFVAADQFLNQAEVRKLGFKNSMFIIDHYHLQKKSPIRTLHIIWVGIIEGVHHMSHQVKVRINV